MFRRYPKIVAVVLLLVFTQKAGLRLWMHHWFHENKTAQNQPAPGTDKFQLKCDCIDDAMMPLLDSPQFIVSAPIRQYATLTVPDHSHFLSADQVFYSLKGPPSTAVRA